MEDGRKGAGAGPRLCEAAAVTRSGETQTHTALGKNVEVQMGGLSRRSEQQDL